METAEEKRPVELIAKQEVSTEPVLPVNEPLKNAPVSNEELSGVFHGNGHVGDAELPTPHFQKTAVEAPSPIFRHCGIHAGIAYFIQANKFREAKEDPNMNEYGTGAVSKR